MDVKTVDFKPKLIGDLLDIIHNAIIVINSENRIIFANSRTSEIFRSSVAGLIDRSFFELFTPEDREIMVPNILNIVRSELEFKSKVMLRCMDDTTFMGMISGTYFQWDNSQAGMAFSIHDLTEMKSIERLLRRSERVAFLGHLVDDISHQIRNPVTVIGGFAKRLEVNESSSKPVNAILEEAARLERLLDSLTHFIHLRYPVPEYLPIRALMDMVRETLSSKVEECGCSLLCEWEEDILDEELLIDKELIIEALGAIVMNGCEAYDDAEEEKNVVVRVNSSKDPYLPFVITVIDTGRGIPGDVYPHIFHHFYSNKTNHVGMGLTLAQRIAEKHRGNLSIHSLPGVGTSVSFHLMRERRRPIRTMKL